MSIGSQDLGQALLWVASALVFLGGLACLAVWIARRRGSRTIAADAALAVAQVWLFFVAAGAVLTVWRAVTDGTVWIDALPASLSWPEQPECGETPSGDAAVVCASVTSVDATVANLSLGTRLLLVAGDLLQLVVAAVPALLIVVICRQLLRGAPFARRASRVFFLAAGVLLFAGITGELVSSIATSLAAAEALPSSGEGLTSNGFIRTAVPLWPVGASIALAALGVVFRQGWTLQRETEGLV